MVDKNPQIAYKFYWKLFRKPESKSYQAHAFFNIAYLNLFYQTDLTEKAKEKAFTFLENAEHLEKRAVLPAQAIKLYVGLQDYNFSFLYTLLANYLASFLDFREFRAWAIWTIVGIFCFFYLSMMFIT